MNERQAISASPTGGFRRRPSRFRVSLIRGNIHSMDDTKMLDDTRMRARHDVTAPRWSGADSEDLYQMRTWGKDYFTVSDDGHVVVRPDTDSAREIDLYELVQSLHERTFTLRF